LEFLKATLLFSSLLSSEGGGDGNNCERCADRQCEENQSKKIEKRLSICFGEGARATIFFQSLPIRAKVGGH
jgi:hypothetical protein